MKTKEYNEFVELAEDYYYKYINKSIAYKLLLFYNYIKFKIIFQLQLFKINYF